MRPAGLEERVQPLGAAAAHALVELGGAGVVAALVGEAGQLQIRLVAALDGRPISAGRKLGQREKFFGSAGVVARRQGREPGHFPRVGLQRIAGRHRGRQRPRLVELLLRRPRRLRIDRRLCLGLVRRRLLRGLAHLRRQLLVQRLDLRNAATWNAATRNAAGLLQGRTLRRLEVVEGDALLHRRQLQRALEVSARQPHRERRRQLAGIALLREEQLGEAGIVRGPRRQRRLGRLANAGRLLVVPGQRGEQHRRRARHARGGQRLHHRGDAAPRLLGGDLRLVHPREGGLGRIGPRRSRQAQDQRSIESFHRRPRHCPPKSQATPPSKLNLRSTSVSPRTRPA